MTMSSSLAPETSARRRSLVVSMSDDAASNRAEVVRLWHKAAFGVGADEGVARYDWFYLRESATPRLHMLRDADSSELIGFVGIGPREWWVAGHRIDAGVLVDFVVLPEHRTLLPAISLQRHAHKWWLEKKPLLYALPNEKSAPIFKRLGATLELELGEYVRLLRPSALLSRYLPRVVAKIVSDVIAMSSRIVLALQLRTCSLRADYEQGFSAEFTEFWRRFDVKALSIGTRNAEYLSWRFSEHPGRCYRTLVIRDRTSRKICGYFVCEVDDGVAYVRDFLLEGSLRQRTHAFRLLAWTALKEGRESVRVAVTAVPGISEALRSALFVRRGGRPVFCTVGLVGGSDWQQLAWFFTPADEDV